MVSPSRGALRLARATAWAVAAMGLSTGAHIVGGGAPPSTGGAALIVGALLWTGLLLSQWRLGRVALAVSLGVSQLVLHTALTAAAGTTPSCVAAGGHHGVVLSCAGGAPVEHHGSVTMLLAHAVAALLLALVLARGEDAVWFLAGLLRPHLPAAPRLCLVEARFAPFAGGEIAAGVPVLGGVGRRGPPVRRAPVVA